MTNTTIRLKVFVDDNIKITDEACRRRIFTFDTAVYLLVSDVRYLILRTFEIEDPFLVSNIHLFLDDFTLTPDETIAALRNDDIIRVGLGKSSNFPSEDGEAAVKISQPQDSHRKRRSRALSQAKVGDGNLLTKRVKGIRSTPSPKKVKRRRSEPTPLTTDALIPTEERRSSTAADHCISLLKPPPPPRPPPPPFPPPKVTPTSLPSWPIDSCTHSGVTDFVSSALVRNELVTGTGSQQAKQHKQTGQERRKSVTGSSISPQQSSSVPAIPAHKQSDSEGAESSDGIQQMQTACLTQNQHKQKQQKDKQKKQTEQESGFDNTTSVDLGRSGSGKRNVKKGQNQTECTGTTAKSLSALSSAPALTPTRLNNMGSSRVGGAQYSTGGAGTGGSRRVDNRPAWLSAAETEAEVGVGANNSNRASGSTSYSTSSGSSTSSSGSSSSSNSGSSTSSNNNNVIHADGASAQAGRFQGSDVITTDELNYSSTATASLDPRLQEIVTEQLVLGAGGSRKARARKWKNGRKRPYEVISSLGRAEGEQEMDPLVAAYFAYSAVPLFTALQTGDVIAFRRLSLCPVSWQPVTSADFEQCNIVNLKASQQPSQAAAWQQGLSAVDEAMAEDCDIVAVRTFFTLPMPSSVSLASAPLSTSSTREHKLFLVWGDMTDVRMLWQSPRVCSNTDAPAVYKPPVIDENHSMNAQVNTEPSQAIAVSVAQPASCSNATVGTVTSSSAVSPSAVTVGTVPLSNGMTDSVGHCDSASIATLVNASSTNSCIVVESNTGGSECRWVMEGHTSREGSSEGNASGEELGAGSLLPDATLLRGGEEEGREGLIDASSDYMGEFMSDFYDDILKKRLQLVGGQ